MTSPFGGLFTKLPRPPTRPPSAARPDPLSPAPYTRGGAVATPRISGRNGSPTCGASRTRSAPRRPRPGRASARSGRRPTTSAGSRCSSSTCRTRSASPASSCSSRAGAGAARWTTRVVSASSSMGISAQSRRSSRRWTRVGRRNLPRALARRRGRAAAEPVHARLGGRRRAGRVAIQSERGARARDRRRARATAAPPRLRAPPRRRRQVRPDDLAVPRNARRNRVRARLGRRGGGLLPHDRAAEPAAVPGERLDAADRALLRDRTRGDRPGRRDARCAKRRARRHTCSASTRS